MKNRGKIFEVFSLCLVLLFTLAAPAAALDTLSQETGKIVILHTNDIHCKIEQASADGTITNLGLAGVAAYKAEMEKVYGTDNVTLVDVGDAISGGVIGSLTSGRSIVEIMNQVGYDLAVPGNHEFDYRIKGLLALAEETAAFPYISSNFMDLRTGQSVFEPYKIVSYGDIKVAYIGICTPEAAKINALIFQDGNGNNIYDFCQDAEGEKLYANVQSAIDSARSEGADYVVALGHLGTNGIDPRWQAEAVIKNTSGMDVFLDGHSHEQYEKEISDKNGNSVILAQTGTALTSLGKTVIDTATGEITHELVKSYGQQDAATLASIARINEEFSELLNQPIGISEFPLTINDIASETRAVRNAESNLGNLTTDAYRSILGTDIAITNAGMLRAGINAGAITSGDLLNSQPFNGDLCVIEASGYQIYEALEMGARNCPEESGGFLQVSGLCYTIDCAVPSPVVTDENGAFVKVEGSPRVKNIVIGEEELNPEKIYTVATNVYIVKYATDGYTNFKDCEIVSEGLTTLNQSVIDYVVEKLDGIIGEEYRNPYGHGRITVLNASIVRPEWYEAVRYAVENNIMFSVDAAGSFSPDSEVTGAMVYQILYNMEGRPSPAENVNVYAEESLAWYMDAVNWASSNGIYGTDIYGNTRPISKVEAVQILNSYFASEGIQVGSKETGKEDGSFTRADLAVLLFEGYLHSA